MGSTECLLLGMMAFDHNVAICNLLHHHEQSKVLLAPTEGSGSLGAVSWPQGPTDLFVAPLEDGLVQRQIAESAEKENIKWTTTIIISSSLESCEVATALENQSHKVRYSASVENGSIIFSHTGVAFLLMDAKECFMSAEEIFLAKIKKFINIHQNSFLVLSACPHGLKEWKLMFRIQQRFLDSNLRILPVYNTVNAIDLMCTIAKITSKPYIDSICYRVITTKAYIIEQSPVWKTFQQINLGDSFNPN
ncbi:protein SPO16 homolog [Myotis daubentonii]|uniref:protein SPO16 homolog n=1 Tax=Myotis daubentonii TaxID=98922 RepID=UPI0028733B0F|nr:protein SPO16 homolog [Myotis daubentonii]